MPTPELTFRPATAPDSDLLADLVLGNAEQEMTRVAMALYGLDSLERVRSLFRVTWRAAENWRFSTVAQRDGEPVGMLQSGHSGMKITPRLVLRAARAIGPMALIRVARRLPLQDKVAPKKPAGSYVVSELHVSPEHRRQGIGEALLAYAEEQARERGCERMALHTLTTNPAQRLYKRNGLRVIDTATDAEFERLTGVAGNVLMVKELG